MSYLRPSARPRRSARGGGYRRSTFYQRHPRRGRYTVAGVVLVLIVVLGGGAILLGSSSPSISADSSALAHVNMPLGGGTIQSVSVVTGPHARPIPVYLKGDQIWPRGRIPAGEQVEIQVFVKRPGSISWLTGSKQRADLTLVTPSAHPTQQYLTLAHGAPLTIHFDQAVSVIATGPLGQQQRRTLASPQTEVSLGRPGDAGSIWVAGLPRVWERGAPALVDWFPAGAATQAVPSPAPGSQITPNTPITLTFSKPVSQALGNSMPPVSPATTGAWHTENSHTIVFQPEGYGYGLGATVTLGLPSGVQLVGSNKPNVATWTVPTGSTLRLQQVLSMLGYLPFTVHYKGQGVALTPQAQMAAAVNPPAASFDWAYPNVPSNLHNMWAPGASGAMTRGAVMAFENDHGITADGVAGATVWKSLLTSVISDHRSSFGYTFVMVSEGSPESLTLWHSGKNEFTVPVNTGIASAPTAQGTYPVFEHTPVTTMSGTNPDGSHYSDPGIPWVSYFNGGDALHGFDRASFGVPQSLGCVEMTYGDAARVYPYTPIGTLVNVT